MTKGLLKNRELQPIRLRGGRMHNLHNIDLDIPSGKLIVLCGVSGSGKTSLAFDTLYAEGQRRYIESFSPYIRQFLPQREKPEYDLLENLPAAIAVKRSGVPRTNRSTVGTTAEVDDYLRILYSRISQLFCPGCDRLIKRHDASSVAEWIRTVSRRRAMITFRLEWIDTQDLSMQLATLQQSGFTRLVIENRTWNLATDDRAELALAVDGFTTGHVVIDRITTGEITPRIIESLETAFSWGGDSIGIFVEAENDRKTESPRLLTPIDGTTFEFYRFARELVCELCDRPFSDPEPRTFSFNSSMGACPKCEGLGEVSTLDVDQRKDKLDSSAFTSRWRTNQTCPECHGKRLTPNALAFQIDGLSIYQALELSIQDASVWIDGFELSESQRRIAADSLKQIKARLRFLSVVGLDYLSLSRPLRTLSGGEATRVSLTTSLGSDLVSMLYVLDEPTIGLHPHDTEGLILSIEGLRDRGNTVIVVEHEPELLERADWLIEIGPQAGRDGGLVCFQGTAQELKESNGKTGHYLRSVKAETLSEINNHSSKRMLSLRGAGGRNLKNIDVDFPLGCLCVVTGVSGSGKSSLVIDTLGAALMLAKNPKSLPPLAYTSLIGHEVIRDCVLIDQDPISLSSRSNPATYMKILDDMRRLFAELPEAKRRRFSPSHFSFNNREGQCPRCEGEGTLTIDMQFLTDIRTTCPECRGSRYRDEILDVKYRDRSIADCLNQTVEEAKNFFRGQSKLQWKLSKLIDIGLGYLVLGQSLSTLSTGEAQRIKLATYLSDAKESGALFLMDEPTTGLHFSDIERLLDVMRRLISAGHSLIVIEHNEQLIRAADYVIDIGPWAAEQGGYVVAIGSPFEIANHPTSVTGKHLKSK